MTQNPITIQIVDALRAVAMALELAVDQGERSRQIDADDLVETLLSVADRLDPPRWDHRPLRPN